MLPKDRAKKEPSCLRGERAAHGQVSKNNSPIHQYKGSLPYTLVSLKGYALGVC